MTVVDIASIPAVGARYEPPGADGIARIVIDRPTDSVNAIDPPLIAALLRAVAEAREAGPRGLIFWSAKPDQFVGGADLNMLTAWPSAVEISEASRAMQRLADEIAALPFVTVAAINGSAAMSSKTRCTARLASLISAADGQTLSMLRSAPPTN